MKKTPLIFLLYILLFSHFSCLPLRKPSADDFERFPSTVIESSPQPFYFPEQPGDVRLPAKIQMNKEERPFEEAIRTSGTLALLILRNDTLVYERYYEEKTTASLLSSFSVAKSFVSALIGIAIEEGYIGGIEEPIIRYLPELDQSAFRDVTIEHLLDMNSGIRFRENYRTGLQIGRYYFGKDIKKQIRRLKMKGAPGENDGYKSINTQLLGLIIERATGRRLSQYLQATLWAPLGAEYDAGWSVDSEANQTEKAFCCLNARARDFAKFGSLYLHHGQWNGRQIIPADWVAKSAFPLWTHWPDMPLGYFNGWYKNHWQNFLRLECPPEIDTSRLAPSDKRVSIHYNPILQQPMPTPCIARTSRISIAAVGHLGQYIYIIPRRKMVFVRFGQEAGDIWWPGLFEDIAELN